MADKNPTGEKKEKAPRGREKALTGSPKTSPGAPAVEEKLPPPTEPVTGTEVLDGDELSGKKGAALPTTPATPEAPATPSVSEQNQKVLEQIQSEKAAASTTKSAALPASPPPLPVTNAKGVEVPEWAKGAYVGQKRNFDKYSAMDPADLKKKPKLAKLLEESKAYLAKADAAADAKGFETAFPEHHKTFVAAQNKQTLKKIRAASNGQKPGALTKAPGNTPAGTAPAGGPSAPTKGLSRFRNWIGSPIKWGVSAAGLGAIGAMEDFAGAYGDKGGSAQDITGIRQSGSDAVAAQAKADVARIKARKDQLVAGWAPEDVQAAGQIFEQVRQRVLTDMQDEVNLAASRGDRAHATALMGTATRIAAQVTGLYSSKNASEYRARNAQLIKTPAYMEAEYGRAVDQARLGDKAGAWASSTSESVGTPETLLGVVTRYGSKGLIAAMDPVGAAVGNAIDMVAGRFINPAPAIATTPQSSPVSEGQPSEYTHSDISAAPMLSETPTDQPGQSALSTAPKSPASGTWSGPKDWGSYARENVLPIESAMRALSTPGYRDQLVRDAQYERALQAQASALAASGGVTKENLPILRYQNELGRNAARDQLATEKAKRETAKEAKQSGLQQVEILAEMLKDPNSAYDDPTKRRVLRNRSVLLNAVNSRRALLVPDPSGNGKLIKISADEFLNNPNWIDIVEQFDLK